MFFSRERFVLLLQMIVVLFVVTVVMLMLLFPGKDGNPGGYRFFYEFVSALGMTKTHEGINNFFVSLIFNSVLGFSMLVLIPFWYLRVKCLNSPLFLKLLVMICCTGFSLGIFGVAITPYNLFPHIHDFSVHSAVVLIVPGMVILMIFTGREFYVGKTKSAILLSLLIILLGEVVIQLMVSTHLISSRPATPILQKISIVVFLFWLFNELVLYRKFISVSGR